jgi:hypothetical protein
MPDIRHGMAPGAGDAPPFPAGKKSERGAPE